MNSKLLSIMIVFVNVVSAHSDIADPVRDYADTYGLQDDSEIIRVDADTNVDGQEEVFLSHTGAVNGKAGNIWEVYIPAQNGYKKLDRLVTFRRDAFVVDEHPDLGHRAIVTYQPGGGGRGKLLALYLDDNDQFIEKVCEQVEPDQEQTEYVQHVLSKSTANEVKAMRIKRAEQ